MYYLFKVLRIIKQININQLFNNQNDKNCSIQESHMKNFSVFSCNDLIAYLYFDCMRLSLMNNNKLIT